MLGNTKGDIQRRDFFVSFTFREDNLVNKEEYHHTDAAIENSRANIIEPIRNEKSGYRNPDAVNGIDNAGNNTERKHIPHSLKRNVAFAAKYPVTLDKKVY